MLPSFSRWALSSCCRRCSPDEKSPSATLSSSTVDLKSHEGGGLRRYHLIKLDEDAIRVLNEGSVKRASLRLRPDMWGRGEFHPFALELCADRVQSLDPDPKVRNPDLIHLNAAACRRRTQRRDQGDHRRVFAHAIRRSALRTVAQYCYPIPAVLLLPEILLLFGGSPLAELVGDLKAEQVTVEVQRAVKIPHTERDVRKTSRCHNIPPS